MPKYLKLITCSKEIEEESGAVKIVVPVEASNCIIFDFFAERFRLCLERYPRVIDIKISKDSLVLPINTRSSANSKPEIFSEMRLIPSPEELR